MVSIRILAWGMRSLMVWVASMPLRRGMRTSIRTTSGMSSWAFSMASAPSPASPTTSTSSSCSSTISSPRRNNAWSSTISTRMASLAPRGRPWLLAGCSRFRLVGPGVAVGATVHDLGLASLIAVHRAALVLPGRLGRSGRLPQPLGGQRGDGLDPFGVLGAVDPPALELLDLPLEAVDDLVDGGGRVGGVGVGTDEARLGGQGDLDAIRVGDARVALLRELHVHGQDAVVEALELGELVLGPRADPLGHGGVLSLHRHLHGQLPIRSSDTIRSSRSCPSIGPCNPNGKHGPACQFNSACGLTSFTARWSYWPDSTHENGSQPHNATSMTRADGAGRQGRRDGGEDGRLDLA